MSNEFQQLDDSKGVNNTRVLFDSITSMMKSCNGSKKYNADCIPLLRIHVSLNSPYTKISEQWGSLGIIR